MLDFLTPLRNLFSSPQARLLDRLRREDDRRSPQDPLRPLVFDRFTGTPERVQPGFHVAFLGDKVRQDVDGWHEHHPPKLTEEMFEWMDLLASAEAAGETFTFIELGAAYGRWSVRAALAARRLGKSVRLGVAEAEPRHVELLKTNMADNGVAQSDYRIFEAAIDGKPGEAEFCVGMPEIDPEHQRWFGQASITFDHAHWPQEGAYYGKPTYVGPTGWKFILVPKMTISAVLEHYDTVDLIDMDIQGAEGSAVAEAVEALTAKVKKLHIGTHAADVEATIRASLSGAGWLCLRDFPCAQENETPFGRCAFQDGVQTWVNPRLL